MSFGPSTGLSTSALAILLTVGAIAGGCGGDDSSDSGASGDAAKAGGTQSLKEFESTLAKYYKSTFTKPPETSPPPAADKNVWVIVFGLAAPSGATIASGAQEAKQALGWNIHVFDGEFSPNKYLTGIRQAIADDADAIVLYAIDCALVQAGLQQAQGAGIRTVGVESGDCSDQKAGGPSLFDYSVGYNEGTPVDYFETLGEAQATWIVTQTDGNAKVIEFWDTDIFLSTKQHEAFVRAMERCESCKIVETVKFTAADIGPPLQTKAQQALVQNPDANAVAVPYDDILTAGVAAAIQGSGRAKSLNTISGGGSYKPNLDLIREQRGQDAAIGYVPEWETYQALDSLNRIFRGQKPATSGIGVQVFDREHNMPEGDRYVAPVDFRAIYEKAWADGSG